jgi:hypothetical protein
MNYTGNTISLTEIRQIDLVSYLSRLGHEPVRINNSDYWYLSPLRNEKIASFKVNRRINRWYDHGMGKGGNLIDFGTLYHQCTIGEFIRQLPEGMTAPPKRPFTKIIEEDKESKILITGEYGLTSGALLHYLQERRIPLPVAKAFCTEVSFSLHHKKYYGIGFKNDSGGYEIRNRHFKAGSSPKDMTTIRHHAGEAVVFEGFMDFLSFQATRGGQRPGKYDFVILNSLSFFERARSFMEAHDKIHLFLDNDAAGQRCRLQALSLSTRYTDESGLYAGYKDFNDWLVNFGTGGIRPPKTHT